MASKMNSGLNIPKALWHGSSSAFIISSVVLAITLFFYIFAVGSYFHIDASPLENRVNYTHYFAFHIISKYADGIILAAGVVIWLAISVIGRAKIIASAIYGIIMIIAVLSKIVTLYDIVSLASIPIVISLLFYNRFTPKKILHISSLPLTYLAILGIAISFVGAIISSAPLFSITQKSIPIQDHAYEIFLLFSSISPFLILFLVLGAPVKLLANKFLIRISGIKKIIVPLTDNKLQSRTKILYLLLFMLLSLGMVLIPHQYTINSDNQQVGSDSVDYAIVMNKLMKSNNPQEFVHNIFSTGFSKDRSVFSLFLYSVIKIVPANTSYVVDRIPMILAPVLVLVIFFLTRELTSNDTTALFASFLTAVSFQTLIGTYSGIYANWLALIIGYLSLVFFIRFLKTANKLNLLVYSILMMLLVFSHANTWTIFAMFEGLYLAVTYKMNHYQRKNIIFLLVIVLSSVAIDIARSSLTATSGVASDIVLAQTAGTVQLSSLWSNLVDTTKFYSGGQFSNFIIFSLGLYWLFRSDSRQVSNIFILVFLSLAILPLLSGDSVIQSRVLYDIPFQIPAAIGLTYLIRRTNGILMTVPVCIWLFAICLRMVTNFYYVSPS